MSRKTNSAAVADAISAAIKTCDDEEFFKALSAIGVETRNVPLRDLPELLRLLRVVLDLHDAHGFQQFTVCGEPMEKGEQVIAWAGDGAGLFAPDASEFCRVIGANRFARYLDRLIALYPRGKLPRSLDKLTRAAEHIEIAAIKRARRDSDAAIHELATALRRWLRTNVPEVVDQIGSLANTTKRVRAFAREIASAFSGKLRAKESTWDDVTVSQFLVSGSHRGRSLSFQVFDGGCIVDGATKRKPTVGFALNCAIERIDRRVKDVVNETMPAFRFRYYAGGKELAPPEATALREELNALWANEPSRSALTALQLAPNEPLLLLGKPMFGRGRPTFSLVHRSTDIDELHRRLDLLAEIFPPVPAEADVPKQISGQSHGIKIGRARPAATTGHRFGGTIEAAPTCGNCRTPVHVILTIDTHDAPLGFPDLGRRSLPILYCLNCMSWRPLYVEYSATTLRIVRQEKEDRANDEPPLDEHSVSFTTLAAPNASGSKLGGTPRWVQGPDIPDCARCAEPMTFVAQVRSLPDMAFDDDGTLYAFVCVGCRIMATFIQSH